MIKRVHAAWHYWRAGFTLRRAWEVAGYWAQYRRPK